MLIKYRQLRKYKYELTEDYSIKIDINLSNKINTKYINLIDGVLNLKIGYAWDGASGPALDTMTIIRASLVHDALYQLIELGYLSFSCKTYADNLLRDICIEDGMNKIRAWYIHKSVSSFGRYFL